MAKRVKAPRFTPLEEARRQVAGLTGLRNRIAGVLRIEPEDLEDWCRKHKNDRLDGKDTVITIPHPERESNVSEV